MTDVLLSNLVVLLALFTTIWVASLALGDASIVDRFWGIAFVVVATATSAGTDGFPGRAHLVTAMVAAWGLRLSWHITARNLGTGEDPRYRAMRAHWGDRFPMVSLATVFLLQGAIAWVVSLPVQAAVAATEPARLTVLDGLGVAVWATGFAMEAVADLQLARFRAKGGSRGRLMTKGLWSWSRHPNYFGDALQWWGLWLTACAVGAWWTAVGPALMTWLLLRVSGVALLERHLRRDRPGWDEYCRRTSAFFPRPPRRA